MERQPPPALIFIVFALHLPAAHAAPEPIQILGRIAGFEGRGAAVELELVPLAGQERTTSVSATALRAGGEIRVNAPEPGFWRVIVRAPETAPSVLDLVPLVESVELPPLHLAPARRITVRVTNPAGIPLAGAVVQIESVAGKRDGALAWIPLPATAVTEQDGSALLKVVPSDHLLLTVTAPAFLPERREIGPGTARYLSVRLQPGVTRVLEARSTEGRPISGVKVVTEGGLSLGMTDADGRLPVTVPGGGGIELRLLSPDCRQGKGALRVDSPGVFTLEPLRRVQGRVVDRQTWRPLAGSWVWLEGLPSCSVRVGPAGRYSLALPASEDLHLRAAAAGYRPESLAFGLASAAEVTIVALTPVQGRPAPVRFALTGRVVDSAGVPVPGARAQAMPATGLKPGGGGLGAGREAVTDSEGSFFLLGFREGEALTVRVERRGFATQTMTGFLVPVQNPLTVVLTPAARIAGAVVDESGKPVGGVKLLLAEDARESGASGRWGRLVSAAETDQTGRFELVDLAAGRFRLAALNAGFLPEMRNGLTLGEGEWIEGMEIVLRRGATIEGRISAPDGSSAAGAKVMVVDAGEETGLGPSVRPEAISDDEGRYEIGGVSEGNRTVLAVLSGYQPARGRVRVEGGVNRLDLRLQEAFEVSGRVSGPEGPVAGVVLRLTPQQDGSTAPPPGSSGPEGAFRFLGVAEGHYRLEVEKPGYTMASDQIEVLVMGASIKGLEVRLERGGTIVGRILGLGLQDLAQVQLVASARGRTGQTGRIDSEGRYRIEGLGPGEWKVVASLPQGRQAGGLVSLGTGQTEALLDLEFTTGFVLSGRVERAGVPVSGALVLVEGADGSGGDAVAGSDGRFLVEGLRPGMYGITALDPRSNVRLELRVEMEGDHEIVIPLPGSNQTGDEDGSKPRGDSGGVS